MEKSYNPREFESDIYKLWEQNGDFKPNTKADLEPYVVMIPPPNVTGSLHLGHALDNTLIDILIRYHRLLGQSTLYMPGTDHAGIATQNRVEKKLAKDKIRRQDIGKEKFIEEVWAWKEEFGNTIVNQLRALGASCDWSRARFTMDDKYAEAVKVAFKHYFDKGLIYEGERLVNWCPRCGSAISDLEVNHNDQQTDFVYIKYPIKDSAEFITVATTRPETMLGDTAVAVNGNDARYKKLSGKTVILPLQNREIPIVFDDSVDVSFGTGAVKVTPGHSEADWEIGNRHNLKVIKVIDEHARVNAEGGKYVGLKTPQARLKIIEDLKTQNLIEKIEKINHSIAVCDRCETPIEPLVSKQWFLKMSELIKPAIKAIENDEVKFYPSTYKKITLVWMKNIKDWCISRQIWWGHPIPIEGTEGVLDTWFSSALWPFATLGWPNKTADLDKFYPTNVLLTAKDIIFLWVSRMIFSGLEFTDKLPFKDVYIHATVLNKEGRRMSKSLGTGVDPMELIEQYGADATRFGLVWQNMGLQQFKFSQEPILTGKRFANKIWNASRYLTLQVEKKPSGKISSITSSDKKILEKLENIKHSTTSDIEGYQFGQALHSLYEFFWHDFCDEYLEKSKPQLEKPEQKENTQLILLEVLSQSLILLHPFMPFVTEAIWQNLHKKELVEDPRLIVAKSK